MPQKPEPPQLAKAGCDSTINSGVAAIGVADTPARHHHRPVKRARTKQDAAQNRPHRARIVCSSRTEDGAGTSLSQAAPAMKRTHERYPTAIAISSAPLTQATHCHARQCG